MQVRCRYMLVIWHVSLEIFMSLPRNEGTFMNIHEIINMFANRTS